MEDCEIHICSNFTNIQLHENVSHYAALYLQSSRDILKACNSKSKLFFSGFVNEVFLSQTYAPITICA